MLISMMFFIIPVQSTLAMGKAPFVSAQAAVVFDTSTNQFLFEKNANAPMLIASLTKVMTAIVALEHGRLSDREKVGTLTRGVEGSSIYLKAGQEISLEDLLYGLMLRSGNDAAVTIAENIGGSIEGFAVMMNETAHVIGMRRSHFVNPSGLDAPGHYATAHDMALLTAYALKNPVFQEIVRTPSKRMFYPEQNASYIWRNKNKMLRLYEGADGVKTGFTKKAGRCLISSATRGGRQLVVVTLKASSDWSDHTQLLNYGFRKSE